MSKPFIGVTCNSIGATDLTVKMGISAPNQDFQGLAVDYLNMLERAGAIPVILPVTSDLTVAEALWSRLDGIILSGGNDVSPKHYNERIKKECGPLDHARDRYEIAAAHYFAAKKIPIFGICRGIQLLNVAFGGTNYQDLLSNGFEQHSILLCGRNEATHQVKIENGSLLHKILPYEEIGVNSFHHQAIRDLALGLEVMARSEDGIVEAVSIKDHPFAAAVQWHPEMMFDSDQQLELMRAFVRACAAGQD